MSQQPVGTPRPSIIVVSTSGETLPGGNSVNLFRMANRELGVIVWDGKQGRLNNSVVHDGHRYQPVPIGETILRELTLPNAILQCGPTQQFWTTICDLLVNFAGLEGQAVELAARTILCSALIEALPVAPALLIAGPDYARGKRLLTLLGCMCRHPLRLTGVTVAGLCSLGGGARFTLLIGQPVLDEAVKKLLGMARVRDQKIPYRGGLLDLFGVQVIHSDSPLLANSAPFRCIQIPMLPLDHALPAFDLETQAKITHEIQAKLLMFRCQKLEIARKLAFDVSKFADELQDLATGLATATPDDVELQGRVFDLLRDEDDEVRAARCTELHRVTCDAIRVAGAKTPGKNIYVSDLANVAQEILRERGCADSKVIPATFGKRLRHLGFVASRDANGKKLLLTDAVINRAKELIHNFIGAPAAPPSVDPSV